MQFFAKDQKTRDKDQTKSAGTPCALQQPQNFDFGLTLGDNFYTYGVDSPTDPRWQTQFEQLYGPIGIKIYPSFGNHDYCQPYSPLPRSIRSGRYPC